jgi:hypothetical protein
LGSGVGALLVPLAAGVAGVTAGIFTDGELLFVFGSPPGACASAAHPTVSPAANIKSRFIPLL